VIAKIAFVVGAILATLVTQAIWSVLLTANLALSPGLPWSALAAGVLLFLGWRYATGAGGPTAGRAKRRRYARAGALPPRRFAWALLAGSLALGGLVALWFVLTEISPMRTPRIDLSLYPPLTVAAVLLAASVVGAVTEEVGLRGYLLVKLEEFMPAPLAILVAAILIAPGHALTQGFVPVVFFWYLVADVAFGALAYRCGSILPGIAIHTVGLLLFFSLIWPGDASRAATTVLPAAGALVIITLMAGFAFARLRRPAKEEPHRLAGGVVR